MSRIYLITGASGHLGSAIIQELLKTKQTIYALALPNDKHIPKGVHIIEGDITSKNSLTPFFNHNNDKEKVLIHCAGVISIQTKIDPLLYEVNVVGTQNILDLSLEYGISKVIHVSSVHAIKELPHGQIIKEADTFNKEEVIGAYAKTKAEATQYALGMAKKGLNISIVHPAGIIGPYDRGKGHFTSLIVEFCTDKSVVGIKGGYDLVDVRDVASGIISAVNKGEKGNCYILSNRHFSVKELLNLLADLIKKKRIRFFLPIWLAKISAPLAEVYYKLMRKPPLFTSYSIYTLGSNSNFSNEKAKKELGYTTRPMEETLLDTIEWLKRIDRI
ncbi:MAG: NAD-dependent epimerase/dehydratase family protein [Bacteroidales bacterium]|nr:NAD-dependent epimerase/dehydratase family protein [Bacteroidales bacterium]